MHVRRSLAPCTHTIDQVSSEHQHVLNDIGPLRRESGTPTIGFIPDSQRMFDLHHAPTDVFENVNRRELELGAASITSLIYLIDKYGLQGMAQ